MSLVAVASSESISPCCGMSPYVRLHRRSMGMNLATTETAEPVDTPLNTRALQVMIGDAPHPAPRMSHGRHGSQYCRALPGNECEPPFDVNHPLQLSGHASSHPRRWAVYLGRWGLRNPVRCATCKMDKFYRGSDFGVHRKQAAWWPEVL